jgi:hypothetical protein
MPEISRFFGIIVRMYYRDHDPPHMHVEYGEWHATIDITTGAIDGRFPRRALQLVHEWLDLHRDELLADWHLAARREPLLPIRPLE